MIFKGSLHGNSALLSVFVIFLLFAFFLLYFYCIFFFFFSSRRRHTRYWRDWSSDVCSSDLQPANSVRSHCLSPARAKVAIDASLGPANYSRMFPELPSLRQTINLARGAKEIGRASCRERV